MSPSEYSRLYTRIHSHLLSPLYKRTSQLSHNKPFNTTDLVSGIFNNCQSPHAAALISKESLTALRSSAYSEILKDVR